MRLPVTLSLRVIELERTETGPSHKEEGHVLDGLDVVLARILAIKVLQLYIRLGNVAGRTLNSSRIVGLLQR